MQFIDTDTDKGIQTKMSTMQPESLEKFSLIDNVCSDITAITNMNEECVKNQEVVKACQKNIDGGDLDAQHTVTRQEPILNEKRDEKEFPDSKENELEDSDNLRIENNSKMQEKINVEIVHFGMIDDGKRTQKKVNTGDNLAISQQNNEFEHNQQNNRLLGNRVEVPDKVDNDITKNKSKTQNKEDATYKLNKCLTEEPIDQEVKQKGEVNDNIAKIYEEDVEMGVTCEKHGEVISNSTDVRIKVVNKISEVINIESEKQEELKENSIVYDMVKENIEIDVTYEEDHDVNNSLNKTKIEDEIQENSVIDKNIEKQNEEVIEMDITCEKHGEVIDNSTDVRITVVNKIDEVIDKESEQQDELKENSIIYDMVKENIEIAVTCEEDHDVNSLNKSKIDNEIQENSAIDKNIEKQTEEVIEMDVTCEKHEVISNSTDVSIKGVNKIGEVINKESEKQDELKENSIIYDIVKENIEMDVTCEEDHGVNNSLNKTKIEDEVQENSVIDKNIGKLNEEVIEMDVTCEKQDKSVSEDAIKEVKDEELLSIDSEKEVLMELKDKVIHNNEHKCVKQDNIEKLKERHIVMEFSFEEEHKVNNSFNKDKIKDKIEENSIIDDIIEKRNVEDIDLTCEKKVEKIRSVTEVTIKETKESERGLTMGSGKDVIVEVKEIELQNHVNKCLEKEVINKNVTRSNEDNQNMMVFTEQYEVNYSVTEDKIEEDSRDDSEIKEKIEEQFSDKIINMDVLEQQKIIVVQNSVKANLMEEQVRDNFAIDDNENLNVKVDETTTKYEQNYKMNASVTKDNIEEQEKDNKQVTNNSEVKVKLTEISIEKKDLQKGLKEIEKTTNDDQGEKNNVIENKLNEQHNENSALDQKLQKISDQDEQESLEEDKIIKQVQKCSNVVNQIEVKQSPEISKTNDNIAEQDAVSSYPCNIKHENDEQAHRVESEKDRFCVIDSNFTFTSGSSNEIAKNTEGFDKIQENILNESNEGTEKVVEDSETNPKLLNCNEKYNTITFISTSETGDTEMDTDEIINIADEKDDDIAQVMGDIENERKIIENSAISKLKSVSTLITAPSGDILSSDQAANISFIQDTSIQQQDLKKTQTENIEEKKKLTHISKLSNTLDILSDEEEDLSKDESEDDVPECDEKQQCTSINIDDDDDIVLIDDEPKSKNDKNKPESLSESESENYLMDESNIKGEKEDQCTEIFEGINDAIQTEFPISDAAVIKTGEPDICAEATVQEETPVQKKPLIQLNFLKSCLKNLADMTRDELEEFCILKIVESVVDRSNLSEIKSQLKTVTQKIDEYKKKASILVKQNRDLQVVIKSVQEEQKKKSNMPITPLKITRSVGMQVLMTDKIAVRKKIQNPNQNNAASNSGINRQGKAVQNQTRLQKMLISTNNTPSIPVPRLVPAMNNSNSNNIKTQSPNVNISGKSQVTGQPTNSPIQTVSNGLPVTHLAQKPEKRPHSRMQQSNSFTVDLTDDEPPSKVVLRNVTPPVRLVPPQNLLAPNRQPFGANMSNPRKVYIPISGSQTPVGVRPGQTLMLKTISTPGPRQRVPTPSTIKSNTVRMQRIPCRHPAPLPDCVKQYQPLNWKGLPPAPELKLSKVDNGIVISWRIDEFTLDSHEEIASYQLYAYQETSSPPSTALWKKIGDVKALPLPMACTLTQFMAGFKYYFAVRAVDIRSRLGAFSVPGSILLLNTT